jgi:hypothetical protein
VLPPGSDRRRVTVALGTGLACLAYLAHGLYFEGYVVDDAGISFSYARNLARGAGLVLSPGAEPVEGYSNFLWTVILAASYPVVGGDLVLAAKALGLGCGIACIVLTQRLTHAIVPEAPEAAGIAAGALVAANSSYAAWSISGLENALFALLLLGGCLATIRAGDRPAAWGAAGALMAAVALTRPEGILYGLAIGSWAVVEAVRRRRPSVVLAYGLAAGLPLLGFEAWRLWYFGDWLPNTYQAKVHEPLTAFLAITESPGWTYLERAARRYRLLPIGLAALLPLLFPAHRSRAVPPALMLGAGIGFVAAVGGDWMGQWRFLSWLWPLLYALVVAGLSVRLGPTGRFGLVRAAVVIGCVAALASPIARNSPAFKRAPTVPIDGPARAGEYFQVLAARAGVAGASLLTPDVGGAAYGSDLRIIDLAGLADRHIARHRYQPEAFRRYVFEERRPTFIHTHGFWSKVSAVEVFPELARDYVLLRQAPASGPHSQGFPARDYARKEVFASILAAGPPSGR